MYFTALSLSLNSIPQDRNRKETDEKLMHEMTYLIVLTDE